ncbi:MAG: hypothetical protein J5959_20200, partial [Butyrivibrio sp.]|nr:hypothetical protein [Butyrivibrio sp.]
YFIRGIKNIPGKKVLLSKYASVFKDKVNEKNRYKQIEDGASDLYIKDQNSKKLNKAFNKIHSEKFNTMIKAMKGRKKGCDRLTYNALSAFMTKEDNKNKSLLDNYLGISVDEKTNEVQGINRKEALDEITRTILEIDITEFDLKDDSAISEKAESFEDMQNKVGAYDRLLSNNPEYLKELPEETKIQLQNLKVICNYYQSRKDLLNDEYYRTHYDDELSMNMNGKLSREQKQVAQKLMNNFVIGKALRMLSGRDVSTLVNPVLNNRALLLSGLQGQNLFFDNNYKSTDHLMGGIRVDSNNLQLNSGKELYKLFAFSGVSEISEDMKKILDVKDDDIKLQKEKAKGLKTGNRDDVKEILKRLKEKLGKEEIADDVANPLMNCKFSGLVLTRMLGNLYYQNTAHLSTDDILSMLLKIAAPSLPENQNIKAGSEEAEKINQTFMEGIGEYKKILLDATKSLMGSFGSIPMQLSVEDSMKMAAKYGDLMYIANSFNQDISQLLIGLKSIPGYKFTQEDKELEELNEYYRTSLVSLRITMAGMPFGG